MPEPFVVKEAADLRRALLDSNPGLRLGILRHIAAHPERALAYGCHEGRDVVDFLVELADEVTLLESRLQALTSLFALRDPRVVEQALTRARSAEEAQVITLCLARLGEEAQDERARATLTDFLMTSEPLSARARTAANILVAWGLDLSGQPAVQLRLSLVSDLGAAPPPLQDASREPWLRELHAVRQERARQYLLLRGALGLDELKKSFDELSPVNQAFVLEWGRLLGREEDTALLARALESEDPLLLECALAGLKDDHAFAPRVTELWQHSSPEVRVAALRAGAREVDLVRAALEPGDTRVRLTALERLAREEADPVPTLIRALQADHWTVRSAARRLLVERGGEDVLAAVRPLVRDPREEVRTAAGCVLVDLDQEAWLESEVLECP